MKKLFALLILGGFFAYFIWPTRYIEYPAGEGPYASTTDYPTRVDRLCGDAFAHRPTGEWVKLKPPETSEYRPNPVTSPYTRSDGSVVNQQMNNAASTQAAVDATSKAARR